MQIARVSVAGAVALVSGAWSWGIVQTPADSAPGLARVGQDDNCDALFAQHHGTIQDSVSMDEYPGTYAVLSWLPEQPEDRRGWRIIGTFEAAHNDSLDQRRAYADLPSGRGCVRVRQAGNNIVAQALFLGSNVPVTVRAERHGPKGVQVSFNQRPDHHFILPAVGHNGYHGCLECGPLGWCQLG